MIARGLVVRLGASQLILWGVSYYIIALFGEAIVRETGWSGPLVYGGFSAALVTMGLVSGRVGRVLDRHGGRLVMTAGSCLVAAGCLWLAAAHDVVLYYLSWIVLGVAMRMCLYDAAFAALVRIGGAEARLAISQVTLPGGLASTVLWPVGAFLADHLGWRGALVCYAALALLTVPLHLTIPSGRYAVAEADRVARPPPLARTPRERVLAGSLFALMVTLGSVINSALSAHMIALLGGLGMGAAAAIWAATLRGVGQSLARFAELLFGRRIGPLTLGIVATAILPVAFAIGLQAGASAAAGLAFCFTYGAGFGLVTIVRGTQPLVLFDPESYGAVVGRLIAPSFFLSALSPVAFAALIEAFGDRVAMQVATMLAASLLASAVALWLAFRNRPA